VTCVVAQPRFLLAQHWRMVEELERTIGEIEGRIGTVLAPFREAVGRLTQIPGIDQTSAQVLVAEIGVNRGQFPTVGHLRSWAGLCPRLDESAGKQRSTRVRKGAPWLKPVLVQCAWAAARSKNTYFQAQFLRLKGRRGAKKAAVAVAASILTAAYYILRNGASFRELGPDHFVRHDKAKVAARLARRLRHLGYEVEIRVAA
jgi:transposase